MKAIVTRQALLNRFFMTGGNIPNIQTRQRILINGIIGQHIKALSTEESIQILPFDRLISLLKAPLQIRSLFIFAFPSDQFPIHIADRIPYLRQLHFIKTPGRMQQFYLQDFMILQIFTRRIHGFKILVQCLRRIIIRQPGNKERQVFKSIARIGGSLLTGQLIDKALNALHTPLHIPVFITIYRTTSVSEILTVQHACRELQPDNIRFREQKPVPIRIIPTQHYAQQHHHRKPLLSINQVIMPVTGQHADIIRLRGRLQEALVQIIQQLDNLRLIPFKQTLIDRYGIDLFRLRNNSRCQPCREVNWGHYKMCLNASIIIRSCTKPPRWVLTSLCNSRAMGFRFICTPGRALTC